MNNVYLYDLFWSRIQMLSHLRTSFRSPTQYYNQNQKPSEVLEIYQSFKANSTKQNAESINNLNTNDNSVNYNNSINYTFIHNRAQYNVVNANGSGANARNANGNTNSNMNQNSNSLYTVVRLFERALFAPIPHDLFNTILDDMEQNATTTSTSLSIGHTISVLAKNMAASYCEAPLDNTYLLANLENLFNHPISNRITRSSCESILWSAFTRVPVCRIIAEMVSKKIFSLNSHTNCNNHNNNSFPSGANTIQTRDDKYTGIVVSNETINALYHYAIQNDREDTLELLAQQSWIHLPSSPLDIINENDHQVANDHEIPNEVAIVNDIHSYEDESESYSEHSEGNEYSGETENSRHLFNEQNFLNDSPYYNTENDHESDLNNKSFIEQSNDPNPWEDHIRFLLAKETKIEELCPRCLKDLRSLSTPAASALEIAINSVDPFSLENIEEIPSVFLYQYKHNHNSHYEFRETKKATVNQKKISYQVYVFDLVHLWKHITTSDKNPFNKSIFSPATLLDIRQKYENTEIMYGSLKLCDCSK